jgi:hypothetical protein
MLVIVVENAPHRLRGRLAGESHFELT